MRLLQSLATNFRDTLRDFHKWNFIKKLLKSGGRYVLIIEIKEINGVPSYEYYAKGQTNKDEVNAAFLQIIEEIEKNLEDSQIKNEIEELTKTN